MRTQQKLEKLVSNRTDSGGVRTKTAMHYFDEFPTWRNFVVMRAVFWVSLIIVCTTFAGLFSATILDLESSGIVK